MVEGFRHARQLTQTLENGAVVQGAENSAVHFRGEAVAPPKIDRPGTEVQKTKVFRQDQTPNADE